MILSKIVNHTLKFKVPAGTSRGTYIKKEVWYLKLWTEENPGIVGIGEVAPLKGLSIDDREDLSDQINSVLEKVCKVNLKNYLIENKAINSDRVYHLVNEVCPKDLPSLRFALETALLDLINGGQKIIFPGTFARGEYAIPINGLIWMGDQQYMMEQLKTKLDAGFDTIKIKVGAIDFDEECSLLEYIRSQYSVEEICIRLDANGAFTTDNVYERLNSLSKYDIHSIEQPIRQGQRELMKELCKTSPIRIALDEELIGVLDKKELLQFIKPSFIILKPTLHGGLSGSAEWIKSAEEQGIGWWITSALESNIGLNAIAQFSSQYNLKMPQGLGTGQLFTNNIQSALEIKEGKLHYNQSLQWGNPN